MLNLPVVYGRVFDDYLISATDRMSDQGGLPDFGTAPWAS
jgi:hypothetical protein